MIDATSDASKVLVKIYKPEYLFLKKATVIKPNEFIFGFIFPEYDLITDKLDHISGIQMHLAIFQGFFTAIYLAIREGYIPGNADEELQKAFSAMIVRENVDFVQPVKSNTFVEVEFKLSMHGDVTIGRKHKFFRISFNGFIKGEAEAISKIA